MNTSVKPLSHLPRRKTRRVISPALLVFGLTVLTGFSIGLAAIMLTDNPVSELVQDKWLSLRMRASTYLPQPEHPAFVPTPLVTVVAFEPVVPSPESPTPSATALAQATPRAALFTPTPTATRSPTRTPTPSIPVTPIQPAVLLKGVTHDWQKWDNCGPTTLEMDLSYFGLKDTQSQVAAFVKPNPEDLNVRPDELAAYASQDGLRSFIRVNGDLDLLKLFLSNGLPVIAETAFVKQPQGWMGHYRLLIGFDDKQFNTMDSYDGPNVKVTFDQLDAEWRAFDRLLLVVFKPEQETLVRTLLGDLADDTMMNAASIARARAEIAANPKDPFAQFNLGTSLVASRRFKEAAAAFDQARLLGLPWRMLWYQFGPYEAYLGAGRYDEVIALADATLKTTDLLEESHFYKGIALRALGRAPEARREFQAALRYNKNYQAALQALSLSSNQ